MGIITDGMISKSAQVSQKKKRVRRPTVDLGACTRCGGCVEVAPEIFCFREDGRFLEVCDLDYYDPDLVEEAIKYCPEDCIYWDNE